jgi:glycerol-3-phosphate dehydrogenase (NAD(P)+)
MQCAVIGAGAWGTALADLLARGGHDTIIWARETDVSESINSGHENRRFLAGAGLSPSLRATSSLADAFAARPTIVLFATPSHVLRMVAKECESHIPADAIVTVATKGIERESLVLMSDVISETVPGRRVVALSGPSFAAEVVAGQPTAVVAASAAPEAAEKVQVAFSSSVFRVYTDHDVKGVELGGALKNVMAVATGIAEGLGLGFNSRAALITRGLAEMTRLGMALGAEQATFAGLAGMGDLVLTCTGALSRNRALGFEIGSGATLEQALAGKETVAEGVTTAQSAFALAQRERVEMPIVQAVHRTLFDGYSPRAAISDLMERGLRTERD